MSDASQHPPDSEPRQQDRTALRRSLLKLDSSPSGSANTSPMDRLPSLQRRLDSATAGQKSCCQDSPKPEQLTTNISLCCGGNPSPAESASGGSCCGGDGTRRIDWLLWSSLLAFAAGLAAHFFLPGAPPWLASYGHACVELAAQSWWGLLAGILAVAVIGRVPRELIAAALGRGGSWAGLFRAVLAGLALDLCNHGILMVGASLYRRGASLGQTVAFLIASPWNSLSLTLILAALIGWKWMLLFVTLSALVALLTGRLIEWLVQRGSLPANPHQIDLPDGFRIQTAIATTMRSLKPGWSNYHNLVREGISGSTMVLRWILLGFVLAALVRAFMPDALFQQTFGPTLAGLLLTLLATTVIEVCSEGSSPIAADLLTRAHAPGNAFVFLMAGAATDYTEMMVLRQITGSWKAALALPLISTPQVLLIGWLLQR